MKKALFIGGTGTISMSITRLIAERADWELYVLNRGNRNAGLPPAVKTIAADIRDAARMREAVSGHTFDVVANFIGYTPEDARRDVDLFLGKTRQYIFISTCAAYHKPVMDLPITESTPQKNPFWQYASDKIASEQVLYDAFRARDFPLTVVRPSHTYDNRRLPIGVGGSALAWQILQRMRRGKPVVVHGDGTSMWTVTHADDFAVGFAGLMANPLVLGHAFNLVSDDVYTWNGIYQIYADILGVPFKAVHIPSDVIGRVRPDFAGTIGGDKAHCLVFDNSKIRRYVPEFHTRKRLPEAARGIIAGMLAHPEAQKEDAAFDAWCDGLCERFTG
ncbi:MAG: NAD-dependent epimerase/dehydratase family protein [Planctomycetota bacterium]|jgi:nucleoside-diphosphate-sugar epimerase|nr:NAD-dependent epimerase/dehydratase family protein [Planctomycetota bacterium]